MNDDNLGNFFNADDFGDEEEDTEGWKPLKVYGNALFKKAISILNLTQSLSDILPDNDKADITKELMLHNAMTTPKKVKAAIEVDEIYSMVMEQAVLIKINMVELRIDLWACVALHGVDLKYVEVLKNEIEEFRKIFVKWVANFEKESDFPDEWHLFNNPSDFPDNN